MKKVELKSKEKLDDTTVVCRCEDYLLGEMRSMLSESPEMTFDKFKAASGVGERCTACLLDLEYYFIQLPRSPSSSSAKSTALKDDATLPLRRKLYGIIDRWSPKQRIRLPNHVPVVMGRDIEQWLWLANYPLNYDTANEIPDFDIDLTMYDASGNTVWKVRRYLPVGGELREELTQHFPQNIRSGSNAEDISIGWLDVTRYAKRSGVRGTTRPQIEIVTPNSSCAVHGQAAGFNTGSPFDLVCCPDDDRVFVSIINPSDRPVDLKFEYPIDPLRRINLPVHSVDVTVPAHGVRLQEIILEEHEIEAFRDRLFRFAWSGPGTYKAHVFISSKQLDRFSVDHA